MDICQITPDAPQCAGRQGDQPRRRGEEDRPRRGLRGAAALRPQGAALRDSAVLRAHAERPVRQPRRARASRSTTTSPTSSRSASTATCTDRPEQRLGLQLPEPPRGAHRRAAQRVPAQRRPELHVRSDVRQVRRLRRLHLPLRRLRRRRRRASFERSRSRSSIRTTASFDWNNLVNFDVGIGLRIFFNRWLAAVLEVRDIIYFEKLENIQVATGSPSTSGQPATNSPLNPAPGTTRTRTSPTTSSCKSGSRCFCRPPSNTVAQMRTETRTAMKRRFVRAVLAALAAAVALSATGAARGAGAPAHRSAQGRAGGAAPAALPRRPLRDRARRCRSRSSTSTGGRSSSARGSTTTSPTGSRSASGARPASSARRPTSPTRSTPPSPRDPLTAINVNHSATPNGQGPTPASFADQTAKISYVVVAAAHVHPVPRQARHLQQDLRRHRLLRRRRRRRSSGSRSAPTAAAQASPRAPIRRRSTLTSTTKIAPTFGVGLTFYPSNFVSLGVEYRALPFSWNRAGFDSRGAGPNGNFPDQQGQQRRRDLQVQPVRHHRRRLLVPDQAEDQRVELPGGSASTARR